MVFYNEKSEEKRSNSYISNTNNYVEKFIRNSVWYDGAIETLRELKNRGWILGIATMKTMPQLEVLVRDFHCRDLLSVLKAAKEDGSLSKDQMLMDIKKEYPEVEKYIMVGDTMGDYKAAKEVGYDFVAADYGYGDIKVLEVMHIEKFKDLLEIKM